MITTIQIRDNVKSQLDKLKKNKETYEEIILNLMRTADKCNREQEQLLIEGCKAMAEENLKITKDFEAVENLDAWEW